MAASGESNHRQVGLLYGEGTAEASREVHEALGDTASSNATMRGSNLSGLGAFLVITKINWGIGMVAMPYYLHAAGFCAGLIFFAVSMALAADAALCLVKCREEIPRCANATTYAELMRVLLGRPGELAAVFSLAIANWGSMVAYVKFIGDNLSSFLPRAHMSGQEWSAIVTVPLLLIALVDDVTLLERFSAVGLVAGLGFTCLIVGTAVPDGHSFPAYVAAQPILRWDLFPVAMGLVAFCNEGMVVMTPTVHAAMRRPKSYPCALWCMTLYFSICYLAVAVSGDFVFSYVSGGTVNSDMTLSFDKSSLYSAAAYLYVAQLLMSIPSVMFVFFSSFESAFLVSVSANRKRLVRLFLIIISGATAVAVPHFGDFLAVTGGVGNSLGIYILPHLATLRACRQGELKATKWRKIASWIVLCIFGIAAGILATIVSFAQLVK